MSNYVETQYATSDYSHGQTHTTSPMLDKLVDWLDPVPLPEGGGGGGGCPNLLIWNGNEYIDEGVLNIHNNKDINTDTVVFHLLETNPSLIHRKIDMKLAEISAGYTFSHSYIDHVRLYARTGTGEYHELALIQAHHSVEGNVKNILRYTDDIWTETLIGEEIYLQFLVPGYIDPSEIIEFTFMIEGHNPQKV